LNISKNQIIKIHIAKKELNLSDENYRNILSGFITEEGTEAGSCKDLNEQQAEILLDTFKKLGWKPKARIKNLFEKYRRNDSNCATPEQMLKVYDLWQKKSKEKTEASLINFAKNIIKKDHISFWLKKDMPKLINAVKNLK